MKSRAGIGKLILSLLVIAGTAELITGAVAHARPQAASSINAATLPSVKLLVEDWHPHIILRVYNYAHVDSGLLLGAEAIAAGILRETQVEPMWVDCPLSQQESDRYPKCHENWGTNAFVLNLLTPEMAARIRTRVEPLGSAMIPCDEDATSCPISVFYFRVEELALQFNIHPERVFGHVLAHEIGHMLLGANHSSKGIMRGAWGRDDLKLMAVGILDFSTDQAAQLRATLLRRAAQQDASQNLQLSASR